MKPATWPRRDALRERLLWIDTSTDSFGDTTVGHLAELPRAGDVIVVNDSATLPSSLTGEAMVDGRWEPLEIRLGGRDREGTWRCVAFGRGDWRTKTELRPPPPGLTPGARLRFGRLSAVVVERASARLFTIRFDSQPGFWPALYQAGRPVQYSYVDAPLELFHVQTSYASRPWSMEMPSAGRPLRWSVLLDLKRRGVGLASVTHAAGLSSSGDAELDATLPWEESFDIPRETIQSIHATQRRGGRVIAVGTSVVRALEACAAQHDGELAPGEGTTKILLGPGFTPKIVSGLLTGIHEATATHFALLQAFVPRSLLERAYAHAEREGYLGHELGDSCLILEASQPTSL